MDNRFFCRFIRLNREFRGIALVLTATIASIFTFYGIKYFWFIWIQSLWSWGFSYPLILSQVIIGIFGCFYLAIGSLIPLGTWIFFIDIISIYLDEKELKELQFKKNTMVQKVFIVHGHDNAVKNEVARFIEKINLTAVILHEQTNKGQTIIEKFEKSSSNIKFAIILLTPDDLGTSKSNPDKLFERARQNVILELGYFTGLLGRKKVCVLLKSPTEIPGDYLGVVYIDFNNTESWKFQLVKEMKEAGLKIDLNLIISCKV